MVEKESKLLLKVAKTFEMLLSVILVCIIFFGMIDLIRGVYSAYIVDFANPVEYSQLNGFLAETLLLVIGVELVVMLSLHVPGALLEVLLFAIARKLLLLPKTSGMLDLLLGIIAIAFIFVIRKYLMSESERKNTIHRIYDSIKGKSFNKKNTEDVVS